MKPRGWSTRTRVAYTERQGRTCVLSRDPCIGPVAFDHERQSASQFACDVANIVCFLHDGVIHERGTPEQVLGEPRQERTRTVLSRLRRTLPG